MLNSNQVRRLAATDTAPASDPVRRVLAGVPPVSFPGGARKDGAPQMTCFPSCLGAVLRFLKEDFGAVEIDSRPLPPVHPLSPGAASMTLDRSYVMLMGASGAAFRLNWAPDWADGGGGSDLPEVKEPLRQAAERCRDEHDLVWEMWRIGGSSAQMDDVAALRHFASAAVRRQLAEATTRLRDADRQVAELIEQVLVGLDLEREGVHPGPPHGPPHA